MGGPEVFLSPHPSLKLGARYFDFGYFDFAGCFAMIWSLILL